MALHPRTGTGRFGETSAPSSVYGGESVGLQALIGVEPGYLNTNVLAEPLIPTRESGSDHGCTFSGTLNPKHASAAFSRRVTAARMQ